MERTVATSGHGPLHDCRGFRKRCRPARQRRFSREGRQIPSPACYTGILGVQLPCEIDSEFLELLGIVAAVQEIPLFGAFRDFPFLRADLLARDAIHLVLGH